LAAFLDQLRYGRRLFAALRGQLQVPLLRTGFQLGLFDALREPQTAEQLAQRQGLAGDLVEAWLLAASAHGLLRRSGDRFRLSGFVSWLHDAPEASALHAMLDQSELTYAPLLARLPELMKGAERPHFGEPDEALRAASVSRLLEKRALDVLARVPGVRKARRVLDVGCGYGSYLAGLLARHRDAHGLGIDLDPSVAEEARRTLREAEVSRRGEIRVGDFMTLDLPPGSYDLALLNNNLHYFSLPERRALLQRIHERLAPGGVLAIQTPVVVDTGLARRLGSAASIATFDLFLRAHRNLHGLPDLAELAASLKDSGFDQVGQVPIVPGGTSCYVWATVPHSFS